jgi:hypothetical protein
MPSADIFFLPPQGPPPGVGIFLWIILYPPVVFMVNN